MIEASPYRDEVRIDALVLLLTLCPLLAISDTLLEGAAAAIILITVTAAAVAIFLIIRRWLTEDLELPAVFITYSLLIAVCELLLLAVFPRVRLALAVFLPLLVCNFGVFSGLLRNGSSARHAVLHTSRLCAFAATALLILGSARELVGHGSLLHGVATSFGPKAAWLEWTAFDFDMGFLLAMLPPGAFIALGLLLALRNVLQGRR